MNPFDRRNNLRVAVFGATGGIGRALVGRLLETLPEGARVLAVARDDAKVRELRGFASSGAVLSTYAVDVMDEAGLARFAEAALSDHEGLDVVIHCVGGLHGNGLRVEKSLRDVTAESLTAAFAINAVSFLLVAKHCRMLLRHEGPILLAAVSAKVGSIGDNQLGGWYGYRMAKAALNMAVRNVSLELHRPSVPSICVAMHPGTTATSLSQPFTKGYVEGRVASPEITAERMLATFYDLQPEQSGTFMHWDGTPLPW